jgi:hypothetical protein
MLLFVIILYRYISLTSHALYDIFFLIHIFSIFHMPIANWHIKTVQNVDKRERIRRMVAGLQNSENGGIWRTENFIIRRCCSRGLVMQIGPDSDVRWWAKTMRNCTRDVYLLLTYFLWNHGMHTFTKYLWVKHVKMSNRKNVMYILPEGPTKYNTKIQMAPLLM